MTPNIRPAIAADTDALAAIAGETLFPAKMLAPMIALFLHEGTALWLTALQQGAPCGFAFAEPEALTEVPGTCAPSLLFRRAKGLAARF